MFNKSLMNNGNEKMKIKKEILLEAINDLTSGKRRQLRPEEIGCEDIAVVWNKMIHSLCNNRGKCGTHLDKINETVESLTKMDFAKELIEDVRRQKNSLESMAANSEEMAAAVNEVANRAHNVAINTDKAMTVANEGSQRITKAFEFVENSFSEIDGINNQMKNVIDKTQKINHIIDIVKGIADQTNLLALNAAIEAARAGEQGRGFAVVADEVRSLAEHTKNSVADIHKNIKLLEKEIEVSVERIKTTSEKLHSGKVLVDGALESINGITSVIKEVNIEVTEIAANTEEQTAVSQNFASETSNVAVYAEKLIKAADRTGKAIFDVSKMCNNLKVQIVQDEEISLNEKQLIDICKTDHLMWRWRVYNMLLGYENIDVNTIGSHFECRLGKWYYSQGKEKFGSLNEFLLMEKPHADLHKFAKEAAIAYQNNDISKAERALAEMDKCSVEVVSALEEIKRLSR